MNISQPDGLSIGPSIARPDNHIFNAEHFNWQMGPQIDARSCPQRL